MQKLKKDWVTDGLIDAEYKRYILLSYLKSVRKAFGQTELYPSLGELVFHYNNLLQIKKSKSLLSDRFPIGMTGIDKKKLELIYKEMIADDDIMKQLTDIIEYSLPQVKGVLEEGKEIYEFVESHCELLPIGLMPLYVDEGYFFVTMDARRDAEVYRYQVTLFEQPQESYRGIHVQLVDQMKRGVGVTYEGLKRKLINKYKDLPNPATFAIESKYTFPLDATLIPVAKRLLVRYISIA
ncbi:MAG: hypothetical protein AAGF85_01810 [Bacteroidota bacterium]